MSLWIQLLFAVAAVIAVDFVSGLVHWAEDTFGTVETPIVGRWIIAPNVLHHHDASAFVGKSWFASSWDLILAASLIAAVAWWSGVLSWPIALACAIGANANAIHKWNHVGASRAPKFVRWLWSTRVLQRPEHHAAHHRGDKNLCYCVVTPFVNPVLDRAGFWRGLERVLVPLFGAPRREDLTTSADDQRDRVRAPDLARTGQNDFRLRAGE